jgi:DNA invertase Pin-like site-specific DNA recombinase
MAKLQAVAYYRTSSAANVGADKDSEARQRAAVAAYARRCGLEIVEEFYDAAVSGADPIDARPGFGAMLARIACNGVRTILVETANRFARDLMVQEIGHARLKALGVELIAVDSPQAFLDETPTAKLMRQMLGAIAEFDKAMTVAMLRGARQRKKALSGKCEGRKSVAEINPAAADLAWAGRAQGLVLREISESLAASGHMAASGKPFAPSVVAHMLRQRESESLTGRKTMSGGDRKIWERQFGKRGTDDLYTRRQELSVDSKKIKAAEAAVAAAKQRLAEAEQRLKDDQAAFAKAARGHRDDQKIANGMPVEDY